MSLTSYGEDNSWANSRFYINAIPLLDKSWNIFFSVPWMKKCFVNLPLYMWCPLPWPDLLLVMYWVRSRIISHICKKGAHRGIVDWTSPIDSHSRSQCFWITDDKKIMLSCFLLFTNLFSWKITIRFLIKVFTIALREFSLVSFYGFIYFISASQMTPLPIRRSVCLGFLWKHESWEKKKI